MEVDLVETVKMHYLPAKWTNMSSNTELELVEISSFTDEYAEVVEGIKKTLSLSVLKMQRIQNPYIWGCYLLKKAEYESRGIVFKERTLYHETYDGYVKSIAKNNFNWRLSGRRAKYGEGVSFSHSAAYAHKQSTHGGTMLVSLVLVGNTQHGNWHDELPTEGVDTTTSDWGSDACDVYVKFSDHEFYPQYVVYFNG